MTGPPGAGIEPAVTRRLKASHDLTHWLQQLDAGLFHWVNPTLSNPVFDAVMPFVSGNPFFVPAVALICALMICKGGARGRICVLALLLAIALTDGAVCNTLKHLIGRPRPFLDLADVHMPPGVGRTGQRQHAFRARRQLVRGHDGALSFITGGACGSCCRWPCW